MPEDWRDFVYKIFQPLDTKVSDLSNTTSEHKMALKILGAGLVIVGTALGALAVAFVMAVFKIGGIG